MAKKEKSKLERRFKILPIDQQLILEMVVGLYRPEYISLPDFSDCLPEGSQVLDVHYNLEHLEFDFLIHNKAFEIVSNFAAVPFVEKTGEVNIKLSNYRKKNKKKV